MIDTHIRSFALAMTVFGILALAPSACGGGSSASDTDGGSSGFAPVDSGFAADCVNLCRQQVPCDDTSTFLTGVVRDPAGRLPIPNAIVYVPNAPVAPIADGASCERCGAVSGNPLVATLTDASGHFVLKDVPSGANIPLVVQIGKWRRQLVVPNVVQCNENPLADVRLPKDRCEGDLPRIALTTGGDDALECWLRKIGIDDAEITTDAAPGRVHLYGGSAPASAKVTTAFDAAHGGQTFTSAQTLWSDAAKLARYDLVLLACEGDTFAATKPQAALDALGAYANGGGRVLASHLQRYWFSTQDAQTSAFPAFATWTDRADPPAGTVGAVDTRFPKGTTLKAWLGDPAVAALDANGAVALASARHDVDAVTEARATQWVTFANPSAANQTAVALLGANTPIGDAQACGRIAYAGFHASPGDASGAPWPGGCASTDLAPEEKALAWALFDLASCVVSDHAPPAPPSVSTPPCTKCDVSGTGREAVQTATAPAACH